MIPPEPRVSLHHRIGFAATVVGMFMAILDIQIVSASLSDIQAGLSAAPDEASWIQTSYLIAEIVMIPLSGYLSRALSTRLLYTLSCAGFTLFPGAKRVQIGVLVSLTATMALTIGPSLGGWLTEVLSWHWLFLINLPIGLVVGTTVWLTLDIDRPEMSLLCRFDWWGLGAMALFLGSLEYVMEEGPRWGWLDDADFARLALLCGLSALVFVWRVLTRPDPIIELRAFRDRNFAAGCLFSRVVGVGLYGLVYVLPLFLARVRAYNAMQIGETLFITGLCMFATAPFAGKLSKVLDLRLMLALGMAIFAAACWWIARLTWISGFWEMAAPLALRGVGLMFMFVPVNQITFGTLAPPAIKNAAALHNLMRNLGGAFGLAAINSIIVWRGAEHRLHLSEQVNWARPNVQAWLDTLSARIAVLQPTLPVDMAALRRLQGVAQRETLVLSYNDVLLLMGLLFALSVPLVLMVRRPRVPGGR